MKKNAYLYRVSSWLKHHLTAWNTGGEGVHSPYLFEWVRMVMSDKNAYYVWSDIENVRARMLKSEDVVEFVDYGSGLRRLGEEARDKRKVRNIAKGSLAEAKYARMLFRLVNWLGHYLRDKTNGLKIVELGTSLGITTAYLASVDSRDRVVTYEGCEVVSNIARENWNRLGLNNIECKVGEIDVCVLSKDINVLDIAFIDANHTHDATLAYFDILARKVHQKSVLVIDDIHHSEEMELAWNKICKDERITSTIDLYQMGLVFFDKNYWRRNYIMRL